MATKREIDDVDTSEGPQPVSKRQRKQNAEARRNQNPGTDPTWGQKYVFSRLANATTIPAGEEDEFEDDSDAMAYLNSVRQEADEIPYVLVAPKPQIGPQLPPDHQAERGLNDVDDEEPIDRSIYTNHRPDARGWYSDGAYVARPNDWLDYLEGQDDSEDDEYDREVALHEAYFSSLVEQYIHLRAILNSDPPSNALSRLSSSHPTSATTRGGSASSIPIWSRLLRTTDPHPLQLALMSKDTIMCILRILLGGKFLRQGHSLPERTSRWIWALLARLPEKGELNYMEIGWVRDLGRRAVLMGRSLAEMALLREELEEGGLGVHEGVDGSSDDEDVMGEADDEDIEDTNGPDSLEDEDEAEVEAKAGVEAEAEVEVEVEAEDEVGAEDEVEAEAEAKVEVEAQAEAKANDTEIAAPKSPSPKEESEEGEASEGEGEDVAMEIASDPEAEDGEIAEDLPASLEDVRTRLLAELDGAAEDDDEPQTEEEMARERARMNMRATLNMILTVAGEFYGQRDLLEFREPFVGM